MSGLKKSNLRVILANPRGFCAGVERAIEIVERALQKYGPPVYVRHEIVHNQRVVDTLRSQGAVFVEDLHEIPDGGVTIFSAHGTPEAVELEAERRDLPVLDATCPLVTRVHREGQRYAAKGYRVVMIGHAGHPEVEGTQGRIPGGVILISAVQDVAAIDGVDPDRLAYVTQTTLSVDDTRAIIAALRLRFPNIVGPDVRDICYATQNRQSAVRQLAKQVDLLLVVGANNSSNSNRLREIGLEMMIPSYLLPDSDAFCPSWLEGVSTVGITAGASAPERLVEEVIAQLRQYADIDVENQDGVVENVRFKLPEQLHDSALT